MRVFSKKIYLLSGFVLLMSIFTNAYGHYCEASPTKYQRKLLEKTVEGLFLVQDFYDSGEKKTDPFLLEDEIEALKKEYIINPCYDNQAVIIVGKYITYFDNGQKSIEGYYKDGKRIGIWMSWYKTGEKFSEAEYEKDNKYQGKIIYWDKNGLKQSEDIRIYAISPFKNQEKTIYSKNYYWNQKTRELISIDERIYDERGSRIGIWRGWCHYNLVYEVEYKETGQKQVIFMMPNKDIKALGCFVR